MNSALGIFMISVGLAFNILACVGLVRLPDVYTRLQAATKCVTAGTCSILLGTFFVVGFCAAGIKALLCLWFLLLTAPVIAHTLSRGAHRSGVKLAKGSVVDRYAEDQEGEKPRS